MRKVSHAVPPAIKGQANGVVSPALVADLGDEHPDQLIKQLRAMLGKLQAAEFRPDQGAMQVAEVRLTTSKGIALICAPKERQGQAEALYRVALRAVA